MGFCLLLFVYSVGQCVDRGLVRGQQWLGKYFSCLEILLISVDDGGEIYNEQQGDFRDRLLVRVGLIFIEVFINLKNGQIDQC